MGFNDLPKIHSREHLVEQASLKIKTAILEACADLTDGEELKVIADAFGSTLSSIAKYAIRAERHPDDPDKPGGLE